MNAPAQDPIEAEKLLQTAVDTYLAKGIPEAMSNAASNRSSELGLACDTYHVLLRTQGRLRPAPTLQKQKIFRLGNLLETPNVRLLEDAGIKVKDRIGAYEWPAVNITGKLDAWVDVSDFAVWIEGFIPFEHKTCSPQVFRAIQRHKAEGIPLTKAKYFWLRKYPGQLTCYELLKGKEAGLWMFFEKASGDFFFWLHALDMEYAEELVARAERVNKHVAEGTVPDPALKEECHGCPFAQTSCFVDREFGQGYHMVFDQEVQADLRRMLALEAAVAERDDLHDKLIGGKSKPGIFYGKDAICGDIQVKAQLINTTSTKVPSDIAAKFKVPSSYYKMTVIDLAAKNGHPE